MELCFISNSFDDTKTVTCCTLQCLYPISILFQTKDDFQNEVERLCGVMGHVIFKNNTDFLTAATPINKMAGFKKNLFKSPTVPVVVLFPHDLVSHSDHPVLKYVSTQTKYFRHKININIAFSFEFTSENLYDFFSSTIKRFLSQYVKAMLFVWDSTNKPPNRLLPHHYIVHDRVLTIMYPGKIHENQERLWRNMIHTSFSWPLEQPLLKRGQALHPVPNLSRWLGPNSEALVSPHNSIKDSPVHGTTHLVKGRYTYKHYTQDNIDDRNWGCAYRSLQTIISWLMWQGRIRPSRLPTLEEIQRVLVRIGDKPSSFIGSRQWIGSLEVSFYLSDLYGVQCQLLPVNRGSDMSQVAAPRIAQHFSSGGGPIMVGGGQLAHTIIGVHMPPPGDKAASHTPSVSVRYLVLDPHYLGPCAALKTILDKGWCGWKDASFWRPDVHYNLCFPPPDGVN